MASQAQTHIFILAGCRFPERTRMEGKVNSSNKLDLHMYMSVSPLTDKESTGIDAFLAFAPSAGNMFHGCNSFILVYSLWFIIL